MQMNVERIKIFNSDVIEALCKMGVPYLYSKKEIRKAYISDRFKSIEFDNYYLHDGDGELSFI